MHSRATVIVGIGGTSAVLHFYVGLWNFDRDSTQRKYHQIMARQRK
jgi:hypothetical protein